MHSQFLAISTIPQRQQLKIAKIAGRAPICFRNLVVIQSGRLRLETTTYGCVVVGRIGPRVFNDRLETLASTVNLDATAEQKVK